MLLGQHLFHWRVGSWLLEQCTDEYKVCSTDIVTVIAHIFYFQYLAHEACINWVSNYKDKKFQLEEEQEPIDISEKDTNIPLIVTSVMLWYTSCHKMKYRNKMRNMVKYENALIFTPSLFSFHILSVYLPYMPIKGYTMKDINRIKIVLVEQKRTGKWLAEQLGKDPSTVSKWCSNKMQPSLEMLMQIAEKLDVDVRNLIVTTKS